MMPTNETGPASETAAPVASDALTSATRSALPHVDAARRRRLGADADEVEHARQRADRDTSRRDRHERGHDRRVAADVERSHQPAHVAERLGEVGEVLHERDSTRREQRAAAATPPSSSTVLDVPRRRAVDSP